MTTPNVTEAIRILHESERRHKAWLDDDEANILDGAIIASEAVYEALVALGETPLQFEEPEAEAEATR